MERCVTCEYFLETPLARTNNTCTHEKISESAADYYKGKTPYLSYPYDEGGSFEPSSDFGCVLHSSYE